MEAWENVINTAMLGTDKQMPGNARLPDEIAEIATTVDAIEALDKEAKFLYKAALIYNYRQCGFVPLQQKDLPTNMAPDEIKPCCSEMASKVLGDILNEDNTVLLEMWLGLCNEKGLLLLPDALPAVLDIAVKDKSMQPLTVACSGNRGLWLSKLNPAWNYFAVLTDEETWQIGKPEDRVKLLEKMRQHDPAQAREWLQQTWTQENAANRVDLLKTLKINAGAADLEWLESLQGEKAQKVKDEVINLLKLIPRSSIVNQYEEMLRQSVTLKKEKALLGMMTKVSIQQKLPDVVDERIFKSGIEKLAGQKATFSDESFILYQLIGFVPPSFWEKQFDASPQQVVEYFEKYADTMVGALGTAVSRFGANNWMPLFLNQENKFYLDYINVLPKDVRDKYLLRFLKADGKNAVHYALMCKEEWGSELALAIISEMANHPYEFNRAVFSKQVKLIPFGILDRLEKIEPKDINLQQPWEKNRNHLIKLLGLKQQMLKAFNA